MSKALAGLARDTTLVRAPELVVRLSDDDAVRVELPEMTVTLASLALEVLVAFQHPTTVGDAMDRLGGASPARFVSASEAIVQLHRVGALVPPDAQRPTPGFGFAATSLHVSMLRDKARTRAFCDALAHVVQPTDVVIDLGTGTGILATRAALAGARRVLAVESTGIADLAARVFVANHVTDRVTLLRGRSTEVEVPERATVLVAELLGDDPLAEDLLEVVLDARKRLLATKCTIIPSRVELIAIPVALSEDIVARHVATRAMIAECHREYGVDLSPLLTRRGAATESMLLDAREMDGLERLGAPVILADLDLARISEPAVSSTVEVAFSQRAALVGIAITFRATLADGIVLSPMLPGVDPASHWKTRVWLPSLDARTEDSAALRVDYVHRRHGSDVRLHFLP